jgi:hypothetical protein
VTLIAFVTPDNHPFLIADVLASTTDLGLPQSDLRLPSGDTVPFDVLGKMAVRPAGFTRKITEILPNLIVAWSGSLDQAKELITQMKFYFQHQELTRDSLSQFVTVTASDYRDVRGICLAIIGESCIASAINSPREGTSPSYNYYIVAGSGTGQFVKFMKKKLRPFGEIGHPIIPALHLCHHFFSRELEDFSTIKDNFGAAFEIIHLDDGELRRVDDLMHMIVSVKLTRNVIRDVSFQTPIFRQWYQGPHLIVASTVRGASGPESVAYVVPDLLTELGDISEMIATPPPLPPRHLCLQHVIENDGRRNGLLYVAEGEHINELLRFDREEGRVNITLTDQHRELIAKWSTDKSFS